MSNQEVKNGLIGLKQGYNFAKKTGVLSSALGLIPHPTAQLAARAAGMMGMGIFGPTPRLLESLKLLNIPTNKIGRQLGFGRGKVRHRSPIIW